MSRFRSPSRSSLISSIRARIQPRICADPASVETELPLDFPQTHPYHDVPLWLELLDTRGKSRFGSEACSVCCVYPEIPGLFSPSEPRTSRQERNLDFLNLQKIFGNYFPEFDAVMVIRKAYPNVVPARAAPLELSGGAKN